MAVPRNNRGDSIQPLVNAGGFDLPVPPSWIGDALCAQTDPEQFFPEKGGSPREAKAICARCPVAAECLDYALEHEVRFGIWGGLSERERRKIAHALGKNFPIEPQETSQESA